MWRYESSTRNIQDLFPTFISNPSSWLKALEWGQVNRYCLQSHPWFWVLPYAVHAGTKKCLQLLRALHLRASLPVLRIAPGCICKAELAKDLTVRWSWMEIPHLWTAQCSFHWICAIQSKFILQRSQKEIGRVTLTFCFIRPYNWQIRRFASTLRRFDGTINIWLLFLFWYYWITTVPHVKRRRICRARIRQFRRDNFPAFARIPQVTNTHNTN